MQIDNCPRCEKGRVYDDVCLNCNADYRRNRKKSKTYKKKMPGSFGLPMTREVYPQHFSYEQRAKFKKAI